MSFWTYEEEFGTKEEKDKRAGGGGGHEVGRGNVKTKKGIEEERKWVDLIHTYHI